MSRETESLGFSTRKCILLAEGDFPRAEQKCGPRLAGSKFKCSFRDKTAHMVVVNDADGAFDLNVGFIGMIIRARIGVHADARQPQNRPWRDLETTCRLSVANHRFALILYLLH